MGSGGVEALADCFESQSTMYGLVRLTERRSTVKNETYCSMKCTPESAPTEEDGNVGTLQVRAETHRGRPVGAGFYS